MAKITINFFAFSFWPSETITTLRETCSNVPSTLMSPFKSQHCLSVISRGERCNKYTTRNITECVQLDGGKTAGNAIKIQNRIINRQKSITASILCHLPLLSLIKSPREFGSSYSLHYVLTLTNFVFL